MKDRYNIIKESFDTETGITTVAINTDCGVFEGKVKLDDLDAQYPSLFHASELALSKALRKYAKQMALITREKIQPLRAVMAQCLWCDDNTDKLIFGQATFIIRREIEKLEKELALWNARVEAMTKAISDRIAARDKIVKEYLDKNN